jgi:hypothetical protein
MSVAFECSRLRSWPPRTLRSRASGNGQGTSINYREQVQDVDRSTCLLVAPGEAITVLYWWENFASQGVQVARPMPDVLGPNEVSGSQFGYLQCRLVASEDAI